MSTLEGINSWTKEAEDRNSDLEDNITVSTHAEHQKEKGILKNKKSLRDTWDNIKHNNIRIIGVPEKKTVSKG